MNQCSAPPQGCARNVVHAHSVEAGPCRRVLDSHRLSLLAAAHRAGRSSLQELRCKGNKGCIWQQLWQCVWEGDMSEEPQQLLCALRQRLREALSCMVQGLRVWSLALDHGLDASFTLGFAASPWAG